MRRLARELQRAFQDLYEQERFLLFLAGLLLLRLLVHVDHYVTIRDLDFFPVPFRPRLGMDYRGGRPLSLYLNHFFAGLVGPDALKVKQIFGRIWVAGFIPALLLAGRRAGLDTRGQALALVLVLANGIVFAHYDALGPYFLLMVLVTLQVVLTLECVQGHLSFVPLGLVTAVALLAHRNALVSSAVALLIIIWVRRFSFLRTAGELLVLAGNLAIVGYRLALASQFDQAAAARQVAVYARHLYLPAESSIDWSVVGDAMAGVVPRLLGIHVHPWWLLVPGALAVWGLALHALPAMRRSAWFFAVGGMAAAVGIAGLLEIVARDFFFRPVHGTYSSLWVPLVCLVFAAWLSRLRRRWVAVVVVLAVAGWNVVQGYGFRREGFDSGSYRGSLVEFDPMEPPVHLQFPLFVATLYDVAQDVDPRRMGPELEREHNDFTLVTAPRFAVDVFEYDEVGEPLYRYEAYEESLRRWGESRGFAVAETIHHGNFRRFRLRMEPDPTKLPVPPPQPELNLP
jgi:hypothetical protein